MTLIDRLWDDQDNVSVASEEDLKKKIQHLESELDKKDQDLRIYKKELSDANVELEKLIVRVNDQLQQTLKIQKFLVPTEFPNIQGFEFSTKFSSSSVSGGDYFDIFEHFDKMRFGLFLSSASGYGMSALFLSVLMKLTYQIEDSKNFDPLTVMEEILHELAQQSKSEDQASIFYGVFDRRKYQMTYCNVGQPLAVHYQASSGRIDLLKGQVEPFVAGGSIAGTSMSNQVVDLDPRDKLIFCSAGFLSLRNQDGDSWGMDEILSVIKQNVKKEVHDLRNEIFLSSLKIQQRAAQRSDCYSDRG